MVAVVMGAIAWPLVTGSARGDDGPTPLLARLKSHVETLASPEFGGRSGPIAEKSRVYLVDEFRRLGLVPVFGDSFGQDVRDLKTGEVIGRNVAAKLVGDDPTLRDEVVIVGAHFDALGVRDGVLYPGADDNATAVAMMLEVARCLVASPAKPRRTVVFVGFDLEERGLVGSRYFVAHPPVPIDRIALFLTADMLGRSLGGVCPEYVFGFGAEHSPLALGWVREASASAGKGVKLGLIGSDLLLVDRSDYGPFRARHVPFLFFSTGENPCYHRPSDRPETVDYAKVEASSRIIFGVVLRATREDVRPIWTDAATDGIGEVDTLREVYKLLQANRERLNVGRTTGFLMDRATALLDGVAERGRITPGERVSLIRMTQAVMASLF